MSRLLVTTALGTVGIIMVVFCRLTPSKAPEMRNTSVPAIEAVDRPPRDLAASLVGSSDDARVRAGVAELARSSERGDIESQLALAGILRTGTRAVAKDLATARVLYERTARADHPSGAYYLASMCAAGEGGPRDASAAVHWLSRAAELGSPHAMFMLANAYRAGSGVPRDERRALDLYLHAAEMGLAAALQTLAIAYERGELGVAASEDEARRFYMESADAMVQPILGP